MISYKLEYIPGSSNRVYNIWEHRDDEDGVEHKIVAVIYDAGLAIDITDFLNEEQE